MTAFGSSNTLLSRRSFCVSKYMNNIEKDIRTLITSFNANRVITDKEKKDLVLSFTNILAENKKGVDSLNIETKQQLEKAIAYIKEQYDKPLKAIQGDLSKTKLEVEKATKAQNERAFVRLQEIINAIKLPKDGLDGRDGIDGMDGRDGKDGSPDNPTEIREKLESLEGKERLDASAIKNLPKFVRETSKKLLVGGIRFFENLADVSIVVTKKRQDLLAQYNTTNNRWQDGIAVTVGTTAPSNPQINDLWVDTN